MASGVTDPPVPAISKWGILTGIIVIHAGCLLAPWTFTWEAFWVAFALTFITGLLGVTACYHRLLAHRSYYVPKWLEYALTMCGSLAMQGGPVKWVATHRVHHAYSDRASDPHSPLRGFWWAHIGWLFSYDPLYDEPEGLMRFAPDLAKDKVHAWIDRTMLLHTIVLGLLLLAWGGLPYLIWGLFVRTTFVYHTTWLVNSAAHLWGYQNYDTNEGSRNNWWVAALSFGEGWHNNHHAYLHSAAHGLRWWEIDITYLTIRLMGWLGLASRIRLPQGNPARMSDPKPLTLAQPIRVQVPSLSAT